MADNNSLRNNKNHKNLYFFYLTQNNFLMFKLLLLKQQKLYIIWTSFLKFKQSKQSKLLVDNIKILYCTYCKERQKLL